MQNPPDSRITITYRPDPAIDAPQLLTAIVDGNVTKAACDAAVALITPTAPPADVDEVSVADFSCQCTPIEIAEGFVAPPKADFEGHKTFANKHRVHFKGKKREQIINQVDTEEDLKPLFVKEHVEYRCKPPWYASCFPCARLPLLKTDNDLLYHLKLEAAFCPREPLLLLQLKQKAKRFLGDYDMSKYTMKEIYDMVADAVTKAYLVGPDEERYISYMNSPKESERIARHNKVFRK